MIEAAVRGGSRECQTPAGWAIRTALSGEPTSGNDPVDIGNELASFRGADDKYPHKFEEKPRQAQNLLHSLDGQLFIFRLGALKTTFANHL